MLSLINSLSTEPKYKCICLSYTSKILFLLNFAQHFFFAETISICTGAKYHSAD